MLGLNWLSLSSGLIIELVVQLNGTGRLLPIPQVTLVNEVLVGATRVSRRYLEAILGA